VRKHCILSSLLILVMLLAMLPVFPTSVIEPVQAQAAISMTEGEFATKLQTLKAEYPQGYYWSDYNGKDSQGNSKAGTIPCPTASCHQNGYCAVCPCVCGRFALNGFEGWQCFGFANLIAYKVWGSYANVRYTGANTAAGWQYIPKSSVTNFYAGDVVRLYAEADNGHSIFITKVVGGKVYYVDCNGSGVPCMINWEQSKDFSQLMNEMVNVVRMSGNTLTGTGETIPYTTVSEGNYYLKHNSTGKYLMVDGGVDTQLQNISVSSDISDDTAKVAIISASAGYKIRPLCSANRLVNPDAVYVAGGENVNLYADVNDPSQWWGFQRVSSGYIIRNMQNPSVVLSVNGTNVVTADYTGSASQVWKLEGIEECTLFYDANGGTGAPANQTVKQGTYVTIPSTVPTRNGYTFAGWAVNRNATTARYQPGDTYHLTLSMTFYAVWNVDFNAVLASGSCGDNLTWKITGLGSVLTISGTGSMADWTSGTQTPWYSYQSSIEVVNVEKGVTSIGKYAFSKLGVAFVRMGNTVTNIGNYAFYDCDNLQEVTISEGATNIGRYAFSSCALLPAVLIPDSVTTIGAGAFAYCTNLTAVAIPKSVTDIGEDAFIDCSSLNSVSITDIAAWCAINFESSWSPYANPLYYAGNLYLNGQLVTDLVIPQGITAISDYAFVGCGMSTVTIPNSVSVIGDNAFRLCENLTDIDIPNSVTSIGSQAFSGCVQLAAITIPNSVTGIGSRAFSGCVKLASITIPDGIRVIREGTFSGCTGLTSVLIPDSVTSIEFGAFESCQSLTKIAISAKVTNIEQGAFVGCTGLRMFSVDEYNPVYYSDGVALFSKDKTRLITIIVDAVGSYTVPYGVTVIEYGAFFYCTNLTTLILPKSLTSIPGGAFEYACLSAVVIPDSVKHIGAGAFQFCENLTSVTIPESVTSIGYSAFAYCWRLENIIIPDSVTSIGHLAFQDTAWYDMQPDGAVYAGKVLYEYKGRCPDEMTVKNGTLGIAGQALAYRENLISVDLPDTLVNIDAGAFAYCRNLRTVKIPDSISAIGEYAFYFCENMESVVLGEGIADIGEYAFAGCSNLNSVFYREAEADRAKINLRPHNGELTNKIWHYEVEDRYSEDALVYLCGKCGLLYYTDGTALPLTALTLISEPDNINCYVGGAVNLEGIVLEGIYADGMRATLKGEAVDSVTADLSTTGKKVATVTIGEVTTEFTIYVHEGTVETIKSGRYPESTHDYACDLDETKTFTHAGAEFLLLSFDARTNLEDGFDYIYIYDGDGKQIAKYTGTEAAGKTLAIPGDTFAIRLVSDMSSTAYGYSFSSIQAIMENGMIHPSVIIPGTQPTCTQSGLSEGSCCGICGVTLNEQVIAEALGHAWSNVSGCTEVSVCTRCGVSKGEAPGHEWKPATCTEPARCNRCGEMEGEALGHDWKPATCTKPSTCGRCGQIRGEALGHTGQWMDLIPATCTEIGLKARVCSICGETESAEEPATGHSYSEIVTAPTCTEPGYTTSGCLACGDVTITDLVPAKGHEWSAWIVTAKPSCTKEGTQMRFCYCGTRETDAVKKLPHSVEDGVCTACNSLMSGYVVLTADMNLTNLSLTEDLYIDLNGFDLSGVITTNGYAVYGMDSTTDGYTCANVGTFSCVDENGQAIVPVRQFKSDISGSVKRYMAIETEDGYTFHRFYMAITKVSLRTGDTGFGYKAVFYGDEMVLSQIDSFGFHLNLEGNDTVVTKSLDGANLEMGREYSLSLKNFDITAYGEVNVNAEVFLNLKDGETVTSSTVSYSMMTMLQKVCQSLTKFSDNQIQALKAMCQPYQEAMKDWGIEAILNAK